MSEDNVVDFMQRLKERERAEKTKQEQDQAVTEQMKIAMRRIIADAVEAMRDLGATDKAIALRLEIASQLISEGSEGDEDAEAELEESERTAEQFSLE